MALTAVPDDDMAFAGWDGACAGTGACSVALDVDRTVGAAFDDPRLAEATVGPSGGEIVSSDGRLRLVVPDGALSGATTLSVRSVPAESLGPAFAGQTVSASYELGPDGLEFQVPATASFRLDPEPPRGDTLAVGVELLLTESGGNVEPLDSLAVFVAADGVRTVEGRLTHFSPLVWRSERNTIELTIVGVPAEVEVGTEVPIVYELFGNPAEVTALEGRGADFGTRFTRKAGQLFDVGDLLRKANDQSSDEIWACAEAGDDGLFRVRMAVGFEPGFFKAKGILDLDVSRPVRCATAPEPSPPPSLTPGLHPTTPVSNPFAVVVLGAFGTLRSPVALATFSGEDAQGNGLLALFDLADRTVALQRAVDFFAWGTLGVVADPQGALNAVALFVYGNGGYAVYGSDSGEAADLDQTPREVRTDVRVEDAVPAGGGAAIEKSAAAWSRGAVSAGDGGASEEVVFASRDLGVGFVRYRPGGGIGVSDEVLPASQFFGDVISAHADRPGGAVVALARSSNSRVYYHSRTGGGPTQAFAGLGSAVGGMRCANPLCVVLPGPGDPMIVFHFDGQSPPERLPDVPLDFRPTGAALMRADDGRVGAIVTGFGVNSSDVRAVELEFAPTGLVAATFPVSVPEACDSPGRPAYVRDGGGAAALVPCTGSDNYAVTRSSINW